MCFIDFFARYTTKNQFSISGAPSKPKELKDVIEVQISDGKMMVVDQYKEVDGEDLHHALIFDMEEPKIGIKEMGGEPKKGYEKEVDLPEIKELRNIC